MRTFTSPKADSQGSAGPPGGRIRSMTNGTTPTHAVPSSESTVSPRGRNAWMTSAG
ncbi:MAG TPA: hypothetical protein VHF26_13090 [Trebonia sp.]|nr:hypothetical protein [Trebonia sp.]